MSAMSIELCNGMAAALRAGTMTNTFTTISIDSLATISGGSKASNLVLDKLNQRYGSDGVVSFIGRPKFTATRTPGVERASGKFDVDALWGGDTKRSFTGLVDVGHGKVTGLHTKVLGSE